MSAGLSQLPPCRPSRLTLRLLSYSLSVPQWESLLVLETAAAQPVTQQTLSHMSRVWKKPDCCAEDTQH